MKNIYVKWFILQLKRMLCKISFYLVIVIGTCTMLITEYMLDAMDDTSLVYIYNEGSRVGDELARILCESTISSGASDTSYKNGDEYGGYNFEIVDDPDELEDAVRTHRCLCGLVFSESMDELLTDYDTKNVIRFDVAYGETGSYAVKEIVYSKLMYMMGPETLRQFMHANYSDMDEEAIQHTYDVCGKYCEKMQLSIFETIEVDDCVEKTFVLPDIAMIVRWIVLIGVAVTEIISVNMDNRDIFRKCTNRRRVLLASEAIIENVTLQYLIMMLIVKFIAK